MNKDNLNQENVVILDELLKICLRDGSITKDNLPIFGDDFLGDIPDLKLSHYRSYGSIIKESEVAEVTFAQDNMWIKSITGITKEFYNNGGFTAIFNEFQQEANDKKIQRAKNKDEAILIKWTKKTYWWTFGIAIAGFIIGLIALIIAIKKT